MESKARTTQADLLDTILAESNRLPHAGGVVLSSGDAGAAEGAWITTKAQFDQLYQSVDDMEKYLRS